MRIFFGVGALVGIFVSFLFVPKLFRDANEALHNPPEDASRWHSLGIIARFGFDHRMLVILWGVVGGLAGLLVWGIWRLFA